MSKWIEAAAVPDNNSSTTADFLCRNIQWISRHGTPVEVVSDQGGEFKGAFQDCLTSAVKATGWQACIIHRQKVWQRGLTRHWLDHSSRLAMRTLTTGTLRFQQSSWDIMQLDKHLPSILLSCCCMVMKWHYHSQWNARQLASTLVNTLKLTHWDLCTPHSRL